MRVDELISFKPVDEIMLEVVSKGEIRKFASEKGSGNVCTCAGKDETGEISVTLWNDDCDKVQEGDTIVIKDGWCNEYKGQKQVSTGKKGTLEIKKGNK